MKRMKSTVLLSVAAVLAAGSAFANTTIKDGVTGDGSLILDVVDTASQTSFTFDTGKTISSFNGNSSLTFDLSGDANWQAFIASTGASDTLTYNVVGVNTVNPTGWVLDGTSNAAAGTATGQLGSITNAQLKQISALNSFINAVNSTTTNTANSIFASAATNNAAYVGASMSLGTEKITSGDLIGTPQGFYQWTLGPQPTNNLQKANIATFAGQWSLSKAGAFTYSAVPLPPGLALLLSGMALTALIARRRSSGTGMVSMGAAA